ncbi:hypothetical protein [Azospirillum doebereinerae]
MHPFFKRDASWPPAPQENPIGDWDHGSTEARQGGTARHSRSPQLRASDLKRPKP